MRQRIGDIRQSKRVSIDQRSVAEVEQTSGSVIESEDVSIQQTSGQPLIEGLVEGAKLLNLIVSMPPPLQNQLSHDIAPIVSGLLQPFLPADPALVATTERAAVSGQVPEALRGTVRDMASAFSAMSGGFLLSQLPTVEMLAIGLPAVLAIGGYLAAPQLGEVYSAVADGIRRLLNRQDSR